MEENLNWEKKKFNKIQFAENLQKLVNSVVVLQIKEITNKIETLCSMGVIQDETQITILKEKVKQLQEEVNNDSFKV